MSKVQPELIEEAKASFSESVVDQFRLMHDAQLKASMYSLQGRKELRQKFIEALRSGNYQQTKRSLRKIEYGYSYCAIGLAYEVMGGNWVKHTNPWIYEVVRVAYGLRVIDKIIQMNDSGATFADIAYMLENFPWYYWEDKQ